MSDFETHPIGRVAHLKQRIFELEQGSCRYNCRTAKEAFMAGFDAGADDAEGGKIICKDFYKEVTEEAYRKWTKNKSS